MKPPQIAVLVEAPSWREEGRPLVVGIRRAARTALATAGKSGDLAILLADDAKLEALNARFRGRQKPTNVLSFPAEGGSHLGDIALAYGVVAREAAAGGKSIHDHALHLAVHGVLHLLGYDHETVRQARLMEPMEIAVLARLGIPDPYSERRDKRARN